MSNAFVTRTPHADEESEAYVLVDARAVLLDLPEEVTAPIRPPLRGWPSPPPTRSELEWQTRLARRRPDGDAAATASVWRRMARRLQHAWSGAPAARRSR